MQHQQSEMQRMEEQQEWVRAQQREELKASLTSEIANRDRQKALEKVAGKKQERQMADFKKYEQDQMEAHTKMIERQKQAILSNDYERAMAEHNHQRM